MSGQPDLWTAPKPASDQELQQHKLPCDVQVGGTIYRAGTTLLQLVAQHRAIYAQLYPPNKDNLL